MRIHLTPCWAVVLAALLLGQMCRAQAQQYVLDTIGDGFMQGITWSNVVATMDGGTSLYLETYGPVGFLWKMDAAGEPAWCNRYGISSERRARTPDGGLVFCEITGHEQNGPRIWLQVVRTDAQGDVVWSKLLTIHDTYNLFFNNAWLYIATDEEGHCLITMSDVGSNAYQWFYCLGADGEVLWSNHFLFNPNAEHVEHICADGFGGWYFGSYDWGASVFRLGHLSSLGTLTWYNSYAVTGPEFWLGGICSQGFQPVAVGGYNALPDDGDYRWFVMRLNLNGTLEWFRVSDTISSLLTKCLATDAGELLVSTGQGDNSKLAHLSATGEVISCFRSSTHTVDGTSYESWFVDWDLIDTTLTMGNFLVWEQVGSSDQSYQPAVWRLPITDLSACGAEANEVSSVLASNSIVAVQEQPYTEVVVPYTLTDTVCSVTSFTPIGVSDYCYYFTGMPPVVQAATLGRVLTTLLVPGEAITAMAPAARCGITVQDAHGRMLYQGQLAPHSNELIPTSAWAPGLYFVRFQPEDGGRPNVVKVAIK